MAPGSMYRDSCGQTDRTESITFATLLTGANKDHTVSYLYDLFLFHAK